MLNIPTQEDFRLVKFGDLVDVFWPFAKISGGGFNNIEGVPESKAYAVNSLLLIPNSIPQNACLKAKLFIKPRMI